jgi:alkanesulfonate monooxygenase SsuD/methylene tetrahydromethanopterin reductase-like flavin-dependent oxidoreductase (luciferase family)
MDLGIFSNGQRHNTIAADSYDEDMFEIVAADQLGYREVWISEHIGVHRIDTQPAPELFICAAAERTEQIKLGVAVRVLSLYHPIDVATQASACDHITRGRYKFGFGPGTKGDLQLRQRGFTVEERYPRMLEALDLIIKCWTTTEPFDYEGHFYRGKDINVLPKPYQKPYPSMAMASTAAANIQLAGERGYEFFMSQFENGQTLHAMVQKYLSSAKASGVSAPLSKLGVARNIYVSDSVTQAKAELRETASLDIEDIRTHFPFLLEHHLPPSGDLADVNFDQLIDAGMFIVGDPDTVYTRIKQLYDDSGGFGLLMVVQGKDWGTRDNRVRSMRLMKEEVGPRLARLDPDLQVAV